MVLAMTSSVPRWEKSSLGLLPEEVIRMARNELREEDSLKEQALQQFADWVKKNHDLQNVRTGTLCCVD